jgi:hypothetical protein
MLAIRLRWIDYIMLTHNAGNIMLIHNIAGVSKGGASPLLAGGVGTAVPKIENII